MWKMTQEESHESIISYPAQLPVSLQVKVAALSLVNKLTGYCLSLVNLLLLLFLRRQQVN